MDACPHVGPAQGFIFPPDGMPSIQGSPRRPDRRFVWSRRLLTAAHTRAKMTLATQASADRTIVLLNIAAQLNEEKRMNRYDKAHQPKVGGGVGNRACRRGRCTRRLQFECGGSHVFAVLL